MRNSHRARAEKMIKSCEQTKENMRNSHCARAEKMMNRAIEIERGRYQTRNESVSPQAELEPTLPAACCHHTSRKRPPLLIGSEEGKGAKQIQIN